VRLFNPRGDKWDDHFERNGVVIVGRTSIGRATTGLLMMNAADRRRLRGGKTSISQGWQLAILN
jgi:hypothetical protein